MLHSNSVQCTQVLSKDHLKQSIIFSEAQQILLGILKRKDNADTTPFHTLYLFSTGHTKFGKVGFGVFFSECVNHWDVICIFTLMKRRGESPKKHFWLRNRVSSLYSLQHKCHRFYFHYNVLTAESVHYKLIEELPRDRRKMPLLKHMGIDFISSQDLAILIRFLI